MISLEGNIMTALYNPSHVKNNWMRAQYSACAHDHCSDFDLFYLLCVPLCKADVDADDAGDGSDSNNWKFNECEYILNIAFDTSNYALNTEITSNINYILHFILITMCLSTYNNLSNYWGMLLHL